MDNLKEDLKRLSKARREVFKQEDFLKIFYKNKEAQGKITKAYEKIFYKNMVKLKEDLKAIEDSINDLFLEAQSKGLSVDYINNLILEGFNELDLEE